MIQNRLRSTCASALVCLLALLAAGTVFGTPPDYGPPPISAEILRVAGTDDMVDLHVTVTKGIPCDSLTIVLETTGQLSPIRPDNGMHGLTRTGWNSTWGAVYETTLRLGVAPGDTGTVVARVKGCDMETRCSELYVITTGDTLEIYPGRPPTPWVWPEGVTPTHTSTEEVVVVIDTTTHQYVFDLTSAARFRATSRHESTIAPDRPMTEPGVYILRLTQKQFLGLVRQGYQAWPLGEEPDSIVVPDSAGGGSSDTQGTDGAGGSLRGPIGVYLESVEGEAGIPETIPTGELITFRIAMQNQGPGACVNGVSERGLFCQKTEKKI